MQQKTRRCGLRFPGLLMALWCLSPLDAAAQSFRCAGGIVDRGSSVTEVSARCRAPDHVESWPADPPASSGAVWFFNDGPGRLLRMLEFRDERLIAIDNDGYGFPVPPRTSCRPDAPQPGWSSYRLLRFCGEPESREVVGRLLAPSRSALDSGAPPALQRVFRQRWRYDFGPRFLMREYTIDDASISFIRTLDRGSR